MLTHQPNRFERGRGNDGAVPSALKLPGDAPCISRTASIRVKLLVNYLLQGSNVSTGNKKPQPLISQDLR